MCPPEARNNLAALEGCYWTLLLFLVLSHSIPLNHSAALCLPWPQATARTLVFSLLDRIPAECRQLGDTADQNALSFENDSPLGTEPSDKSGAVVTEKTQCCTKHNLSN